jgi:hypothetical protein
MDVFFQDLVVGYSMVIILYDRVESYSMVVSFQGMIGSSLMVILWFLDHFSKKYVNW